VRVESMDCRQGGIVKQLDTAIAGGHEERLRLGGVREGCLVGLQRLRMWR
jgi:hypothetical protein